MKHFLLLLFALLFTLAASSQTIVLQEDFEGSTYDFTSSSTGTTDWGITDSYSNTGTYSDSATVSQNDTIYLTSDVFSTTGNFNVMLEFSHICKVSFSDGGYLEYSTDNGASWTKITTGYLGTGGFTVQSNAFSTTSYPDWLPGDVTTPITQSWWKTEQFDLSTMIADEANVKIRFALADILTPGNENYKGWFIDDVKVTAAFSEMIPPSLSLLQPIVQDTVFGAGPYNIQAAISDASGIDTAEIVYTVYPDNITTIIGMTEILTDTFEADIPFAGFGRTIAYYVRATDLSASANIDSTASKSFFCKFSSGGQFQIGNGTIVNTTTSYPSPYGNFYWGSKEQYLILASELQALGVPGGPISSLSFDVDAVNTCPSLDNYTIKMGATTITAVSSWESGLTQVYSNTAYQPVLGWNTHSFSNNFVWDGTSNIIVEVCFNNTTYEQNASVKQHTTTFNSTNNFHADNSLVCSTNTSSFGFPMSQRPNMKIEVSGVNGVSNDIGVLEFTNPTGGVLANAAFDVKVELKNFGIDTITSANIDWEIDGVAQTQYAFSDSLFPDSISTELILGNTSVALGSHNVKAWTNNPNGSGDNNIANDTVSFDFYACASMLSGTYTIGGATADYPDFSAAALALNQCGIIAPVTFNVASGTYVEQIELFNISGSSATNTVTFQSATNDSSDVVLSYDAQGSTDNWVVKLNSTSNVVFKDMTIQADDSTYAQVFHLRNNPENISIENSVIRTNLVSSAADESMALLYVKDSLGSDFQLNNTLLQNGSYVFSATGTGNGAQNWNFENNIIQGHNAFALNINNAISPIVKNNIISSDSNSTHDNYNAIVINNSSGSPEVSYNEVYSFNTQISYGVLLVSSEFDSLNPAMVYNNMLMLNGNSTTSTLSAGVLVQESKNANIYFNSIHFKGSQTNSASFVIFDNTPLSENIIIKNNHLTNNAGGYIYYVNGVDTSAFDNDYNNLFNWTTAGSGSSNFAYLGAAISDFTSWKNQTAASNSLNYDPYYVGQYDLHAINNILNGTATPISSITDDIDGEIRNTTTPDIGADEFDPSPYDVTALAILSPNDGCGLSNAEAFELQIKNIGSAVINGGLTASFRIDTLATVVAESISATINPGDTFIYTFSATVDLDVFNYAADSTFNFTAWVDLTGDPVHNNDTVTKSIVSHYKPADPIASDTNVVYGNSITITAQSPDSLIWYASDTAVNEIVKTNNFTSPILYDTITYYVAAVPSGAGNFIISEVCHYKTTTGAPTAGWPSYLLADDYIEITGSPNADLAGFTLEQWKTSLDGSYTFPQGTILGPNGTAILAVGQMGSSVASPSNFYYHANGSFTGTYGSSTSAGRIIKDASGNIVDAVGINGYTFPAAANVPPTEWANSPTGGGSTCGFRLEGPDMNDGSQNWVLSSGSPQNPNILNSNITIPSASGSCMSNRVPLTVFVDSIPMHDIGLVSLSSPNSGVELTNAEDLTVTIKNFAAVAKDTLPVAYILDSAAIVRDTLYQTLVMGDSIQYTFNPKLDLDSIKTYTLTVFTDLSYDENNNNDTIHTQFTNSPLTYCSATATSPSYEDITYVGVSTFGNYSAPVGSMYTDFTSSSSINLTLGQTYDISVATDFPPGYSSQYSTWINVFIDYNRDGTFDPSTENVYAVASQSSDSVFGTFTVPFTNVVSGKPIRMRVAMREGGIQSNTGPCGTFTWGEVEDYTIIFAQPIPFDAGVKELIVSDTTFEGYVTNMDAIIMNFGTDTLTNFDIEYVLNNGTPVTTLYTDTLAPMQKDTVALTTFSSPAGASNVCAYTVVTGDINTFNDQSCDQFFGVPVKDAYLYDFVEIDDGCGLGLDTVKIWITNIGIDTINGGTINPTAITANYQKVGGTLVSETVNTTIYPGDSILYTFTNLINLSTNTVDDTIYEVNLWVDYAGDNVNYNDSAYFTIESLHTPVSPIVTTPITINYASPAVLTASASDSIYWYNSDSSNSELHIGSPYITDLIYDDSTYWAEAKGGASGGWNTIGTGTATQNLAPLYGYYDYSWSSIIYEAYEIPNIGRIDSISFHVDNNPSSYTMTDQRVYMEHVSYSAHTSTSYPGVGSKQLVYQGNLTYDGSGWFTIVFQTPFEYNGTDNLLIYCESHDGSYTTGYPQWTSSPATDKVIYDYADGSFPTGTGSFLTSRPNIKFWANPTGCPSNRVSVQVQVNAQMANDIAAFDLLTPNSSVYLTSQEDVELRIMNFGTSSQSNFDVAYQLNGGTPVVETINSTITPGDTIDYTFAQTVDLSNVGTNYSLKLYSGLTTDGNNTNDTIVRNVKNLQPNYCISTATSVYGNDISNVNLAGINNSSPSPYNKLYTDFSSTVNPGFLSPGGSYPIEVEISPTSGTYYDEGYVEVYIDLNRDGLFTEPDELIFGQAYTHSSQSSTYLITGSVTLPSNTISGLTKMRVVNENSSSPLSATDVNPCGTYTYGETEDYNMIIAPRIPKDLGVESIMNLPSITDANSHDVDLRVRNYGTDTISSFDLKYTLNNGAAVTQTVNPTLPLYPGDSVDLIAFANISLIQGQNSICFETVLANDSNTFNDSKCSGIFLEAVLNIPYTDNFDGTTNNWFNDTLQNQWQLGIPSASTLDSAYSAPNAWATWLDTVYSPSSTTGDKLYSPKFIVSNYDSVYVKFWHNIDMDATNDGGYLEFNTGGSTWGLVGYLGDLAATNWYNYSNSGNFYWNSTNGWEQATYNLNLIDANSPFYQIDTVQFRFVFHSNGTSSKDGWLIDDFSMEIPQAPIDGAIDSITAPKSSPIGSNVIVTASVRNAGSQAISNFPVKYKVNNVLTATETFTGTLQPGDTSSFTFNTTFTAPTNQYNLCVEVDVPNDPYANNDVACKAIDVTAALYDAGVSRIIYPGQPGAPGTPDTTSLSYNPDVYIEIVNYGVNTLTNIPVEYYRLSGTGFSGTDTFTGTLNSGDTVVFHFPTTYASPLGNYQICAQTNLVNDANPLNDGTCKPMYGVVNSIGNAINSDFVLNQNEPNPASDNFKINYELPRDGQIRFELHNSLGQLIKVIEGDKSAGNHTIELDAQSMAAGVYYYSLKFGEASKTLKMIVTK